MNNDSMILGKSICLQRHIKVSRGKAFNNGFNFTANGVTWLLQPRSSREVFCFEITRSDRADLFIEMEFLLMRDIIVSNVSTSSHQCVMLSDTY